MNLSALIEAIGAAIADPLLAYEGDPPGRGGPAAFQDRFHRSLARKRLILAGNRLGKTYAGAGEAWWYATGRHPYREVSQEPTLGWILCSDLKSGWAAVSRCLRSLEPPGALDQRCHYSQEDGYTVAGVKMVKLTNGSLMVGKGSDQKVLSLESDEVHWAWVDEPPKQDHFNALRNRLTVTLGPLWVTLTPISRPVEWMRDLIEGNPDEGRVRIEDDWYVEHVEVTYENAPHRTPESIEVQRTECDGWEYNQRILAKWDGVSPGRKLSAFTEALILYDEDLPLDYDELRMGIDHGEGAGSEAAYLVGIKHPDTPMGREKVYLLREYISSDEHGFSPRDHVRGLLTMLSSVGLTVHHFCGPGGGRVGCVFGDTNSAGMLGAGVLYNEMLERAFRDELGVSSLPFSIEPCRKGKGSVAASLSAMNSAMREGRWFVHESCVQFCYSARHFTGREEKLKHVLDGARYSVMDYLLRPWAGEPSATIII